MINQQAYLEVMAAKFRVADMKPIWIPMEPSMALELKGDGDPAEVPYQEVVGHVLWPVMVTCPDILFAVSALVQFTQNLAVVHWKAIKWVMIYLYTMRSRWLTFGGASREVMGYCDADWGLQMDRHSILGYVFTCGIGAVMWSSKQQPIIALLSTEAEYIAMTHTTKEACWFQTFLAEITGLPAITLPLRGNNQSAITLAKDNKFHTRMKHIDICYHFICKAIETAKILLDYMPTDKNIADGLTKALPQAKFEIFAQLIGL